MTAVTTGTARDRLAWVDVAKAVSIVLVVLIHAGDWMGEAGVARGPMLDAVDTYAESLRMPLFFAASGLFAARWFTAPWRDLLNRRLATLVWVFLLWQVVMVAYKTLAGASLPGQQDGSLVAQLLRAAAAPVRPNAELWFLWALVLFFVLARAMRRWPVLAQLGVAAAASLLWSGAVLTTVARPQTDVARLLGSGLVKTPMLFVFFLVGAYAGPAIRIAAARVRPWQAVLGLLPWLAAGFVIARFSLYATFGTTFVHQILGVAAGGCLALLLVRVPWVGPGLAALGRRTLPVYLVHSATVVLVAVLAYRLDLVPALAGVGAVAVLVVTVVGVAAGLLLHRLAHGTVLLQAPGRFRPGGTPTPAPHPTGALRPNPR